MDPLEKCTLCGAPATVDLELTSRNVFRCSVCHHAYSCPGGIAPLVYDREYFEVSHRNWFRYPNRRLFRRIFRWIEKRAPQTQNVLDVGCGKGEFLMALRKNLPNLTLTGVDYACKPEISGVQVQRGDILQLPLGEEKFDLVVSLSVIENYHGDVQAFMRKLASLIRPGGAVVLMTVNEASFHCSIARGLYRVGIRKPAEILYSVENPNHFNPVSLRGLVERCGLDIEESWSHGMPVRSIDTHVRGLCGVAAWLAVANLFFAETILGGRHLQTVICRKPADGFSSR